MQPDLNPDIFRQFSIRGVADRELADDVVVVIGRAIGVVFQRQARKSLVLGRDVRNSSPRISSALVEGLLQAGLDVIDVGVVPTPVLNFATDFYKADGGVMITASHNPPEDNGLKIRFEHTLHGQELQEIYRVAITDKHDHFEGVDRGQIKQVDPLPDYLERVKALSTIQQTAPDRRPLKIVVDGGNGTNGPIVSELLQELGCRVVELYCKPDGNFPNRNPDPTKSGATDDLSMRVRAEGADLGLAYDGDGDRLVVLDENGNRLLGDQIMMILARSVLQQGPAKIVYEILCTQALADDIVAHGGEPVMTPSGYAFVHQAMQDTGAALGGELSGHLFFKEPNFRFDDAILGTVKLLNGVVQDGRPLSALVAELPTYHSSPELRVSCPDAFKGSVVEYVKKQFEQDYKVDTLDGARIHFDHGWALVRQSNTQPRVSMRFEAGSAEALRIIQTRVQALVEAEIKRQTAEKE